MMSDAVCRYCRRPARSVDSTGACALCHPPVGLADVLDHLPADAREAIMRHRFVKLSP